MNNYQKAISRYNQIMGYRPTHIPGKPTAEELREWRRRQTLTVQPHNRITTEHYAEIKQRMAERERMEGEV